MTMGQNHDTPTGDKQSLCEERTGIRTRRISKPVAIGSATPCLHLIALV